jgi:hypothetical protein
MTDACRHTPLVRVNEMRDAIIKMYCTTPGAFFENYGLSVCVNMFREKNYLQHK